MITGKQLLIALAAKIAVETEVKVTLEPDPLDYGYEPVLRLTPADWDLDKVMSAGLVTLKVQASLEASGDDSGVFLESAMDAHLALVLWLNPEDGTEPVLILGPKWIPIDGQALPGPAVQRNEEEGKKPFLYQKTFELGLSLELSALRS